ncbi:transglutaminase-like domain-containing protein [Nocardioides stalactiti]|uniref:transglutaminase-like domain-containing protein n=1 Tax=Nocardioides stalactiti TaxID=2755356 RepID=UPI001600372B|nr:transglutaminase family protein [Nocardioides stalactiti]
MTLPPPESIQPSAYVDSDHPAVVDFARSVTSGASDDRERASRLFAAVRDRLRYDPYSLSADPEQYRASAILTSESAWCVPKAVALAAAARAVEIPAMLGFSDVRNHLSSPKLLTLMGTDLFVYHGWVQMYVGGQWRKASPAFNGELCQRFGVAPLEFDGTKDALLHQYDGAGRRHMEYVRERGVFADLPFTEVMEALRATYGGMLYPRGEDDTFSPVEG